MSVTKKKKENKEEAWPSFLKPNSFSKESQAGGHRVRRIYRKSQ